MSIVSVQPKSFILALFIRDDNKRFLLGDNGYDFKDSQLHFAANTIENDEVMKQGADGVMVAGQVRRASVQSFDGFVGDATMAKETIEQMRRDFIAFFLKGHHYRVIYVDCNRNAWQRKGGYLVDAPEVKELWQIHPEYHVGLNFEDVNYYSYDEDADGNEILANLVNVPVSTEIEGGLVWDEDGAVSEDAGDIYYDTAESSASGKSIAISDATEAPLASFQLDGETSQNGTPTPDAPVAVQTVTGENVVKICGKNLAKVYSGQTSFTYGGGTTDYTGADGRLTISTSYPSSSSVGSQIDISSGVAQRWAYTTSSGATAAEQNITGNGGNYILSMSIGACSSTGGGSPIFTVTAVIVNSSAVVRLEQATININSVPAQDYITKAISLASDEHIKCIGLYLQNIDANGVEVKVQLESGSTATAYEPYQGQSYTLSLGSIELCKIGDYQDYIYKSDEKWYVHKEIGKVVLDSTYYNSRYGTNSYGLTQFLVELGVSDYYDTINFTNMLSNSFVKQTTSFANTQTQGFLPALDSGSHKLRAWIRILTTTVDTADQFKAWLNANSPVFYYKLDTATDTEITNEALVAQLDALLATAMTYYGINNIFTITPNEQGTLEISYYTKYQPMVGSGGYVWEAGGAGGPTVIINNSIDNVSPVWTIYGPTTNPQLENATTGETIEYVGTIAQGQTLTIDMGEQTASLDGLNVISNLVGDFIQLAPGRNNIIYSVSGEAGASELGWSEIVG